MYVPHWFKGRIVSGIKNALILTSGLLRQSITFPYFLLDRRLLPLARGLLALPFSFSLLRCLGELDRDPDVIGLLAAWDSWSLSIAYIGST